MAIWLVFVSLQQVIYLIRYWFVIVFLCIVRHKWWVFPIVSEALKLMECLFDDVWIWWWMNGTSTPLKSKTTLGSSKLGIWYLLNSSECIWCLQPKRFFLLPMLHEPILLDFQDVLLSLENRDHFWLTSNSMGDFDLDLLYCRYRIKQRWKNFDKVYKNCVWEPERSRTDDRHCRSWSWWTILSSRWWSVQSDERRRRFLFFIESFLNPIKNIFFSFMFKFNKIFCIKFQFPTNSWKWLKFRMNLNFQKCTMWENFLSFFSCEQLSIIMEKSPVFKSHLELLEVFSICQIWA